MQQARSLALTGDWATDLLETAAAADAGNALAPWVSPDAAAETSAARHAFTHLEHGEFEALTSDVNSADGGVFRATLAAFEYRGRNGTAAVPNQALDAAIVALARSEGSLNLDVTLARIAALRIRENAFIQIDPPPPLGQAIDPAQFEQWYAERLHAP